MKTCSICSKDVIFAKKTQDGYICSECQKYIPNELLNSDTETLKKIYNKNLELKKKFNCTASYGSLFIDSFNNLFCISTKKKKDVPLLFNYIFHISELRRIYLGCSDIKNMQNKIYCNVKFQFETDEKIYEFTIKCSELCNSKVVGNQIEWNEPPELSMFRNMFGQMIDNEYNTLMSKFKNIHIMEEKVGKYSSGNLSKQWAEGILFLEGDYTKKEIKTHRNFLIKHLHPDKSTDENFNDYAEKINVAFDMLYK